MTAERISELRELRAAADGGEWKPGRMDTESYDGDGTRQHKNIYAAGRVVACGEGYSCRPNATLIAAVVNNLTELLTAAEEVEQSRKEIERLRVENELLREWRTLFLADTEKPFVGSCAWDRPEEAKSASGVPILVECRVVQPLARKRGAK